MLASLHDTRPGGDTLQTSTETVLSASIIQSFVCYLGFVKPQLSKFLKRSHLIGLNNDPRALMVVSLKPELLRMLWYPRRYSSEVPIKKGQYDDGNQPVVSHLSYSLV